MESASTRLRGPVLPTEPGEQCPGNSTGEEEGTPLPSEPKEGVQEESGRGVLKRGLKHISCAAGRPDGSPFSKCAHLCLTEARPSTGNVGPPSAPQILSMP